MAPIVITWEGHFTPTDKAHSDYAYVPFNLLTPARQITVRYTYSNPIPTALAEGSEQPGSVIDIGLFDPRGLDFPGGLGFRGWSGSARREFTVATDTATPGYLPGPLPAGRYHVILGLYRVHSHGVDVQIQIEIEPLDVSTAFPVGILAEPHLGCTNHIARSGGWLRGDLHTHTWHSDAKAPPRQLIQEAQSLGLDFLAVTDHNTVSHHRELAQWGGSEIVLIPGQEVTTYYGHMNVWGTSRWCDFRCRTTQDMTQVIDLAHRHGGICSLNHPKPGGPTWEYGFDLPVDAMEVWHTPWPFGNTRILALWDSLLQQGHRLPGVGGSDYHCHLPSYAGIRHLAMPTTWVWTEDRSSEAILAAILRGHVCMSAGPTGPRIELRAILPGAQAMMGDTLPIGNGAIPLKAQVFAGVGFKLQFVADGQTVFSHRITEEKELVQTTLSAERYIRAELVGDMPARLLPRGAPPNLELRNWRWALSNPIYIASSPHGL